MRLSKGRDYGDIWVSGWQCAGGNCGRDRLGEEHYLVQFLALRCLCQSRHLEAWGEDRFGSSGHSWTSGRDSVTEGKLRGQTDRSPPRGRRPRRQSALEMERKALRTPSRFFRDCKMAGRNILMWPFRVFGALSPGSFCEGLGRS